MGRPRNPKRDEAKKKYLDSGGQISTKELLHKQELKIYQRTRQRLL